MDILGFDYVVFCYDYSGYLLHDSFLYEIHECKSRADRIQQIVNTFSGFVFKIKLK